MADTTTKKKTLEEFRAEAAAKRLTAEKQRQERDDAEELALYEKFGVDYEAEYVVCRFPDAPAQLPGFVVCDFLPKAQFDRFMSMINRPADKPGAADAKAKFFSEIVLQTLKHPDRDRYLALVEDRPFVIDEVSGALIKAARAGAEKSGKG